MSRSWEEPSASPTRPSVTQTDYERAESFLPWNVERLVLNLEVVPHWIDEGERFWYCRQSREGRQFLLVDPIGGTRQAAFDHDQVAAALSEITTSRLDPQRLPFETIEFVQSGAALRLEVDETFWIVNLATYECVSATDSVLGDHPEVLSPDGCWGAYLLDHNIWVRETESDERRQLTYDGEALWRYGAEPDGSGMSVNDRIAGRSRPPALVWSPNSKKLVTHKLDERAVGEMHLLQSLPGDGGSRPKLHTYRYTLVGDETAAECALVVLDVQASQSTWIGDAPLHAAGTSPFGTSRVWWATDGTGVYFVDIGRGHKWAALRRADAATGATRTIVEDFGATYVGPSLEPIDGSAVMVWVGRDGSDVVWMSERDGWAHLYLYDGVSGSLKNQVTSGEWVVREIIHVDEMERLIWFTAGGRELGRDPYFRHLYRIGFDGAGIVLLSEEDADHTITASPAGRHFVDTFSRVDEPPKSVSRDRNGVVKVSLEVADVQALLEAGWRYPERFHVKARDGVTDIFGVIIRPTFFDPENSYPVLDGVYPGPQMIRTPKAFPHVGARSPMWHDQSLAELGFVVINIDGRGTPLRSKAFHDHHYGRMEEAGGLEDHISALRQLAHRHPYLDLDRIGIFGHSAGGYATVRAMVAHPDFYKVGVASAGDHDRRGYVSSWGETYNGLLDGDNFAKQANAVLADRLIGKLLLVYGEMDTIHPAMTIQLIDAFIKANRDFDVLVIPNVDHQFADYGRPNDTLGTTANGMYFIRRRWDYFVEHLLGADKPLGYRIREPMPRAEVS